MAIQVAFTDSHGNKQVGPISQAIETDAAKSLDYYSRGSERQADFAVNIAIKNAAILEKILEYLDAKSDDDSTLVKSILAEIGASEIKTIKTT